MNTWAIRYVLSKLSIVPAGSVRYVNHEVTRWAHLVLTRRCISNWTYHAQKARFPPSGKRSPHRLLTLTPPILERWASAMAASASAFTMYPALRFFSVTSFTFAT
jgi:hypothetical protein